MHIPGLRSYREIRFTPNAEARMTHEQKQLKWEMKGRQSMMAQNGFKSIGDTPYLPFAYDGKFMPSNLDHTHQALSEVCPFKGMKLLDLGSGDGSVVFFAAMMGFYAAGIEGSDNLHSLASHNREYLLQNPLFSPLRSCQFMNGDYFKHPTSNLKLYDIVYLYDPQPRKPEEYYPQLHSKLRREMRVGSIFIRLCYGQKYADSYIKES
jgi:hypothetical protein